MCTYTIVLEVANIGLKVNERYCIHATRVIFIQDFSRASHIADACVIIEASEFIILALGWIGSRRHYGAIAVPDHFKIIEGDEAVRVFVGQGRYFDLNRDKMLITS